MERFLLEPNAVYRDGDLVLGLGITFNALARARRNGDLRYTRQGRQVLYRGQWVAEWLEQGADREGGTQ